LITPGGLGVCVQMAFQHRRQAAAEGHSGCPCAYREIVTHRRAH
jgi:hypothetical protein